MSTKKPKTKKSQKANARSSKSDAAKEQAKLCAEETAWRKRILEEAERIVPFERRTDFTPETLTRLNRNVTQALAMLDPDGQKVICCEEMAELAQLLCRDVNRKTAPLDSIQEEIADVYIIVAQMARHYFSGRDEFNAVLNRKMAKQELKLASARDQLKL